MPRTTHLHRLLLAPLTVAVFTAAAHPSRVDAQLDLGALQDEAVSWLQEYLRINTVNPPGNETAGAEFFARIFEAEGIEYEMAESAPGRGNIWARIEGGDEPGIVLLHHIDVVPADERFWTTDPLSGDLRGGYLYGRGALDTKTSGILHLAAFLALARTETPLNRDVIFMATADEEAGGFFGAGWLVKNRPELFENVGFLLNEGGGGSDVDGT
ncbi:MAG: M20/M25/M40 family metallo-hydrolase, partial [Longimicrobiales bacterium]